MIFKAGTARAAARPSAGGGFDLAAVKPDVLERAGIEAL
jgi:hypothetical protein